MTTELLRTVELETAPDPTHAVIWLHGLGASGYDFPPIVPHLGLPEAPAVRFVFPHAPEIPVTINGGMVMPAWYDITEMDLRRRHDEAGIRRSAAQVEALIAREKERGVPAGRLIVAGFSQGGAIALHTALRHAEPLSGLAALSTYLVLEEAVPAERSPANHAIPIFQAHGRLDPMVHVLRGERSRDRLLELGYRVTWHDYPIGHEVCLEEARDLGAWIAERIASGEAGG